jgi:2-polyprenyl-3-methyl-5-hydroxy-6-metoxy-1,4-benzoquinol methylase
MSIIDIEEQREWWNGWLRQYRENEAVRLPPANIAQGEQALRWLRDIRAEVGRPLNILEVGCGSGWLCEQMLPFGTVSGTDLADGVVARAAARCRRISYSSGDFMALDLEAGAYDVIVSLEVLSHIEDQNGWMRKVASILRPGGRLLLFNQNRWVLERSSGVHAQGQGQVRRWTTRAEVRALARPLFHIESLDTLTPQGDQGLLRLANSVKVSRMLAVLFGDRIVKRIKERLGFGRTVALRARLR